MNNVTVFESFKPPSRYRQRIARRWTTGVLILTLLVASNLAASASAGERASIPDASDNAVWKQLRPKYFGSRPITNGNNVIRLKAPYRAEDPAVVPITVTDLTAGDPGRRIDKLWLVIDNNPEPMSLEITLGPAAANATFATRVRVNTYTHMRVIAETNDHKLYMTNKFVKASGGCSAPVSDDPSVALRHMGEMRLRQLADKNEDTGQRVELMIRHPNITGLQMNQLTRLVQPAHFVDAITIHKGSRLVLSSKETFSLSKNPSLRFRYLATADDAGDLRVKVHDNKNNVFTQRWALDSPPQTVQK